MIVFFSLALIYGLSYTYIFFKLSATLGLGLIPDIFLGLFLFFMSLSPVLIHVYSLRGTEKASRFFAYTGYMWLSFLIIFVPAVMVADIYNLIVRNSNYLFGKEFHPASVSRYSTIAVPFVIALVFTVYGYFEAKRLRVETLMVKTPKLPAGNKIRIAQISDLHLGIIVRDEMLDKVIHEIELLKPDIIVSTGDLLDGTVRHIGHLAKKLEKVRAPMGKYAIMGNHEFYGGLKGSAGFLEEAGFTILSGRGVTIENKINIAGVDYFPGEKTDSGGKDKDLEQEMLSALPAGIFTLLLKHKSEIGKNSPGLFDLQLSGHTHDGQIFPVSLIMPFVFRYRSGYTKLPGGSALYISRGTGTGGPPVRFLSPPELTMIEIVSANDNEKQGVHFSNSLKSSSERPK